MRKPDDELKINISELFGGDLPSPSETLEDIPATVPSSESPEASKIPPEVESQFQEWMSQRNQELEAKSLELERQFQEPPLPAVPVPETPEVFSLQELTDAVEEPPVTKSASTGSPVDFDAPIAPPFMGGAKVQETPPTANVEPAAAVETPAPGSPQSPEDLKKLQAEHEFLMLYDEFRNIIVYELKDLVGEKKTLTMLGRTVELARSKYPEIFRNVNWDSAGNLLEDGSMDGHRIIENKKTIDPHKADELVDAALSALLRLRLQAVEKGLGPGLKNKVRARMYQWISEKTQKAANEGRDGAILKRLSGYVVAT
ncbi:MAG TPA: hypothetical protein VK859_08910 [bacterium]|jgi:hypothetical protein|nr:hypothetical protein [bacterium]